MNDPVEEQFKDIQRRRRLAPFNGAAPTWDDVTFLIDQMEGWRRQADSWARECDRLRAAHIDGTESGRERSPL